MLLITIVLKYIHKYKAGAEYSLRAKFGLFPMCVNKALLEHSQPVNLCIVHCCFHAIMAKLGSYILIIFGCAGSSLLHKGLLQVQKVGASLSWGAQVFLLW